ncbi:MAG: GvpL/GvpF family gas vesicle protein [Symploca sp. SIO2B6]|nr:GvpL/GvpF family gas vesicle protein [Symploca sp. SIO2B6]
MEPGIYLYGILPKPLPEAIALEGLDRQPVYHHAVDGFNFLYSEAKQKKYLTSRRNLLCHEKVLEAVMHEGLRNLLPLSFGLVVNSWESVAEHLIEPHRETLQELFHSLEGRREVSVKIFWNRQAEIESLVAENPELKAKRDEMTGKSLSMGDVIEIGQMIEDGLQLRQEAILHVFRDELTPFAESVVESETMTEEMIYNTAYLIPWETEARFSQVVEAIDQTFQDRLRIRYNSFTAPYTFAQLS